MARHGKVLRDAKTRLRGNYIAGAKVLLVEAFSVNPAKRGGSPAPYPYEARSVSPEPLSPQEKEATKQAVQDMVKAQRDKIRQDFRDRQGGAKVAATQGGRASSLLLEAREYLQEAQVEVAAAMTQHWAEEQRWQQEQEDHIKQAAAMDAQIAQVPPYDKAKAEKALIETAAGVAADAGKDLEAIRDAVRAQEVAGARQHLRDEVLSSNSERAAVAAERVWDLLIAERQKSQSFELEATKA